ncbi:MAG: hypothetical protein K9L68_03790 [Spirochaetales bacterium]|nr:hypothetical protein [Spirochaetales bacterium]MCF7937701.1 hypothetical protein [Spirochaetales bacterium]
MYRRFSVFIFGSAVLIFLLFVSCATVGRGPDAAEGPAVKEQTADSDLFGDAPGMRGVLQTRHMVFPLPDSWRVLREVKQNKLSVFNAEGEVVLELLAMEPEDGEKEQSLSGLGRALSRSMNSEILQEAAGSFGEHEAAVFRQELERILVTVDLLGSYLVALGTAGGRALIPYMDFGYFGQDVRIRDLYTFHSLDTSWAWYSDTGKGFALHNSESGAVFMLSGREMPSEWERFFDSTNNGSTSNSSTGASLPAEEAISGRLRRLVDNDMATIDYRLTTGGKQAVIALKIFTDRIDHYALIVLPAAGEMDRESLEGLFYSPSYDRLFGGCMHFGGEEKPQGGVERTVSLRLEEDSP